MNSKGIKIVVFVVSIIFIFVLFAGVFLNKHDDKLLDTQVDVAHNLSLSKDLTLKLNNSFRSVYVNYDNLLIANKALKNDIKKIVSHNKKNLKIKELEYIIFKQDNDIDLIKRANSLITNSLQFMKYYHVSNPLIYTEISQKLLDMSYEIKLSDYSFLNLYESEIKNFESLKVKNQDQDNYQKSILLHAKMILKNAKLLKHRLDSFNNYQIQLADTFLSIRKDISHEHAIVKNWMKVIQIVLISLLFIFVFLISKFLKIEKLHKEEEKKLQNIIDKNVIMSIIDLNGITKTVSSAHLKISGYSEEDLVGKPNFMMNYSSRAEEIKEKLQSGNIWSGVISDKKKNGEEYWVNSIIEPIFDEHNKIKYYLGIRDDITNTVILEKLTRNQETIIESQIEIANKERDKAVKASKSKSEFLANMSHEIRTPLNAINGFIELLQESELDKKKQEYLKIVNNSSNNLLSIINDILDFSKIESGQLLIDKIDFDPSKEFDLLVKSFESQFKEKDIGFITKTTNLPKGLNADLLRIQQVINNLLSNAYKFTNKNNNVYLEILYQDSFLKVLVKDEGVGISEEYQKKIFDSFSQEDSSTTRKYGGTGLGLSISYNLVKLMDGVLEVESKIGIGSTFHFTIPVSSNHNKMKKNVISNDILFKGNILLAEDNKANQMFMKVILKKLGLDFDIANDGIEAVKMFKKNHYDLILMDENMPNMSGTEATKAILDLEKSIELEHTPIVALTANSLVGDKERFLEAGMDEYLSKPLKKDNLIEVLEKFIK